VMMRMRKEDDEDDNDDEDEDHLNDWSPQRKEKERKGKKRNT